MVTKKEIKRLYSYFKVLANKSERINISSFCKAFDGMDYMIRITASLFNFLDKENKGVVTFDLFLSKFYPHLDEESVQKIARWVGPR